MAAGAEASGGITGLLKELWGTFLNLRDQLTSLTAEERDAALDVVGAALDIGGIFEPTPFCDAAGATLGVYRKEYWGAALTALGIIPLIGDTAKLGKIPQYLTKINKAIALAAKNARCAEVMRPVFMVTHKVLDAVPLNRLPESVSRQFIEIRQQLKSFLTGGVAQAPVSAAPPVTLLGKTDKLVEAAKWIKPKQGVIDVVVHGSSNSFHVLHNGKWVEVNHRTLDTLLKKSGQSGESIRLISCSSGASTTGIARDLANKTGMKVEAPTDTLWIHPNGNLTIGKTPTVNTGQWATFNPGKPQ